MWGRHSARRDCCRARSRLRAVGKTLLSPVNDCSVWNSQKHLHSSPALAPPKLAEGSTDSHPEMEANLKTGKNFHVSSRPTERFGIRSQKRRGQKTCTTSHQDFWRVNENFLVSFKTSKQNRENHRVGVHDQVSAVSVSCTGRYRTIELRRPRQRKPWIRDSWQSKAWVQRSVLQCRCVHRAALDRGSVQGPTVVRPHHTPVHFLHDGFGGARIGHHCKHDDSRLDTCCMAHKPSATTSQRTPHRREIEATRERRG